MIFLRHPTPDIDSAICYGQTDMDIAEIGLSQIDDALISTPKITKLLASPAIRCRKLTLALAERDNIEPIFDARLWEMNMGNFEGVRWDEMDRSISNKWLSDPMNNPTPNGEAFVDLQKRVLEFLNEHLNEAQGKTIVICHASPIRVVQMAWQNISFEEAFKQVPAYAEPIEIWPT